MTMKKHSLQSAILAVALMLGLSTAMTVGHALVAPAAAQAGVLGKIKGAAKTVGKGAASVGKTVGKSVARTAVVTGKAAAQSPIGKGAVIVGKGAATAGKGVARDVKRVAVVAGKALKPTVGKSLARAGSAIKRAVGR
jgi:hypothetical protein